MINAAYENYEIEYITNMTGTHVTEELKKGF